MGDLRSDSSLRPINHDKLRTSFLAGQLDQHLYEAANSGASPTTKISDAMIKSSTEEMLRMLLGESDVQILAGYSKVLFK